MSNRPEEPKEEDCCHNDCVNCVFDIYNRALQKWGSGQFANRHFRYDLLSPTVFKPFVLISVCEMSVNTNLYVLKPKIGGNENTHGFLPYTVGQHLSLRLDKDKSRINSLENHGYPYFVRDFTIVSLTKEHDDCSFEVLIKLYKNSVTSNIISKLGIGDIIYWRGPYGEFKHQPKNYSHMIMVCMGTGIAPMYPLVKDILINDSDETIITLLYGCKLSSEIMFRKELGELGSYWNFKCVYFLSKERGLINKKYNEDFVLSRISNSVIANVIVNKETCFFLICGSNKFTEDMKLTLVNLNISENMIHAF